MQRNVTDLVANGRAREALAVLERLAGEGDAGALLMLAKWYRAGRPVPRDLSRARDLYRRAGEVGALEGASAHIAFTAMGVGGPRDWPGALALLQRLAEKEPSAARQLALVETMALTPEGDPEAVPEAEPLSESPYIARFPGLFSAAECRYLAEAAAPVFVAARTIDEKTGNQFLNPIRTSETAGFPWMAENPAIHALNRRIAAISGTDAMQGEPLQVLRYSVGQEYKPHFDAVPGMDNQRVLTVLVYLNEDFEGGETRFLDLDLTIRARAGDALLFSNVGEDGRPNPRTMHAGLPVTRGAKLLASRWIRERPLI